MGRFLAFICILFATAEMISCQKFENEVVLAVFTDKINETGWSSLTIDTKYGTFSDEQIANNSGFAEGFLTAKYIFYNWQNTMADQCKNNRCEKIWSWVQKQHAWVDQQPGMVKTMIFLIKSKSKSIDLILIFTI